MKKIKRFLKNLLKALMDELDQIQREELFLHNLRGKETNNKSILNRKENKRAS
jgi:hypothetical protein